jgi:branched-subunit amino acid transport protein
MEKKGGRGMIALIFVAMLATFGPRFLPYVISGRKLPPAWERFLALVPDAAMGSLILPGLILDFPQRPWAGMVGAAAALLWARMRGGLLVPIIIAFGLTWFFLVVP